MRNQKGITLIALAVTIIVLLIIVGVSVGYTVGTRGSIKTAKSNIKMSELSQIQQAVLETYIKYRQTNNTEILVGTKISHADAKSSLKRISESLELQLGEYDINTVQPDKCYYKVGKNELSKLGIKNSDEEEEYIINYSNGEVFSATDTYTSEGEFLYVCVEQ